MLRSVRTGSVAVLFAALFATTLAVTADAAPQRFGAKLTTDTPYK